MLSVLVTGLAYGQDPSASRLVTGMEEVLVDVIARAEKSVVAIARVRKEMPEESLNIEIRPDAFQRRWGPSVTPEPGDADFIPDEFATGVVIDRRGLILTTYHVLREDSDHFVTTADRKVYRARVKGADPRSDLAVLAIEAVDLEPITFGDAATLKKGQIVIALGNPHAIARDGQVSASWGIVANLARKAPPVPSDVDTSGKSTLHHFGTLIQTDAKLTLGTSGGALLNLKGEMVGLTTSLAAIAGYEQAAGYAIPIDQTFRRVVETLKQGREVEYGFLGIQPANLASREILSGMHGIRVHRVVPGTPADRYGVKPDDVITAVNGAPVHDDDGLVLAVGRLPVEAIARLHVIRGGGELDLGVTLTKFPVPGKKIVTQRAPMWRGMRIDYPTALIDSGDSDGWAGSGLAFLDEGVVVTDVEEGEPAWKAGLRRGMLVSHVGRTPVRTPREFRAAVAGSPGPVQLRLADEDDNPLRVVAPGS